MQMKANKFQIKNVLLLFFFFLSYWKAIYNVDIIRLFSENISIYNPNMDITREQALKIKADNSSSESNVSFILWNEEPEVSIENTDLSKKTNLSVIEVVGRTNILFSNIGSLDEDDEEGCLIDRNSAYELFGSDDIIGKNIIYDNNKYTIRNVVDGPKASLIVEMNEDSKKTLDTVTIKKTINTNTQKIKEYLFSNYGINGMVLEYDFISDIMRIFLLINPVLLIYLIYKLQAEISYSIWIKYKNKKIKMLESIFEITKKEFFLYLICKAILIVLFVIVIFFLKNSLGLLGEYIPNKWSDFEFWRVLLDEKLVGLNVLIKMPKRGYDMIYIEALLKSVLYLFVSIYLFWTFIKNYLTNKEV